MFKKYQFTVVERFMRYVQVDTQSNPQSNSSPSTEKQKDLSAILVEELKSMGITDVAMDKFGYVYATIPSNTARHVPVICFCSHVDTAPDCGGYLIKPILHKNYNGQDIVLPDDTTQVLKVNDYRYLKKHIGSDIITASGTTLLGADDKAGVAEIMDMVNFIMLHREIKHGTIKILFTPDEEVGRGTEKIDMNKLGGVTGMSVGDKKTIQIPADEAYGSKQDDLVMEFPKDKLPADMKPEVGMEINMSNGQGQNFPVVITDVRDDVIVLDANHPLSGEDLIFDLELMDIKGKSPLIIMP